MKPSREAFYSKRANSQRKHEEWKKKLKDAAKKHTPRPVPGVLVTERVIWD